MVTLSDLTDMAFGDAYSEEPMIPVERIKTVVLAEMAKTIREQNEDYAGQASWRKPIDAAILAEAEKRGV